MNIVFFYADDWTMKVLGKLNPNVRTPNVDKMADKGMLFVNNCVTASVCWISRATLMTGTHYSRHLMGKLSQDRMFKTYNWSETLFPRLRRASYYTGMFTQWHAPAPKAEMAAAFDERKSYYGHHWISQFSPQENKKMEHVSEHQKELFSFGIAPNLERILQYLHF